MKTEIDRVVRAGRLPAVLAIVAVAVLGCVTPSPSPPSPTSRSLFVANPYPRSGLADTGEVPFEVSGTNWGADRLLIIDQCAFSSGEPASCEQIGSVVTGANGAFPLTSVTVHYMLNVGGTSVPCDAVVETDPVLVGVGAFFGGKFYRKHCAVRVSNSLYPEDGLQAWIAFSGHEE